MLANDNYKDDLRRVIINYRDEALSGDKVHVIARVDGKEIINNYMRVFASVESNYSRIYIEWETDRIVSAEYQEHYPNSSNKYPVIFTYFKDDDMLHMEGKYDNKSDKIVVQLPPKHN